MKKDYILWPQNIGEMRRSRKVIHEFPESTFYERHKSLRSAICQCAIYLIKSCFTNHQGKKKYRRNSRRRTHD